MLEECGGDVQKAKEQYSAYLMSIPGSVTFQTFREDDEEDEEDLCATDPNSVVQSTQIQPTLMENQPVPPVTQTFTNQQISPESKAAAIVNDSDSDSDSSSSESESDDDHNGNSVLGKRTFPNAFASPHQDITALWSEMNNK